MVRKLSKSTTSSSLTSTLSSSTTSSTPPSLLSSSSPLPKLIVFDLDYTLWPFWVDTHVTAPLKATPGNASATDKYGEDLAFYTDVPSILQALPKLGVKLGVASRTSAPSLAKELLKLLHLPALSLDGEAEEKERTQKVRKAIDAFEGNMEIYPGSKIKHFESIHKRTGVKYEDMLFFDDESRNKETESLGLTMWLVRDGVSWGEMENGVAEWRRRRGHK